MLVGNSSRRIGGIVAFLLALTCSAWVGAAQATPLKVVRYHGYVVKVPRSWNVYDLAKDPHVCVRFDRHAVYLGAPTAQEQCPAHTVGRTEAILLAPASATIRRALARSTASAAAATVPRGPGAATFLARSRQVVVTATWSRDRGVVADALNRPSLRASAATATASPHPVVRARSRSSSPTAHPAAAVFGGLGFDACSAPSPNAMTAWGASPYRAIGIYIGGANSACAQPNLTSTWVANEVAAGWHMIPIYVGLQAPSNSCGCAAISPAQASAQGTAAAIDAVTDAQGIGIPGGNPIYNDMEGYSRNSTNTSAVLAFLSAWTAQLHAEGYLSGVYSSSGSGVSDLVSQYGTTFLEPDDIWFAEWNNQESVTSAYIPATDWPTNQRLHQYQGGHNETYGKVTINIDNDFVDGATADTSGSIANALPPPPPPTLKVSPASDGTDVAVDELQRRQRRGVVASAGRVEHDGAAGRRRELAIAWRELEHHRAQRRAGVRRSTPRRHRRRSVHVANRGFCPHRRRSPPHRTSRCSGAARSFPRAPASAASRSVATGASRATSSPPCSPGARRSPPPARSGSVPTAPAWCSSSSPPRVARC